MKGILVPAYYPFWTDEGKNAYNQLVQAAISMTKTELLVVLNPNSGPMGKEDGWLPNRLTFAANLRNQGGKVLCYVSTDYGHRDVGLVKADIAKYLEVFRDDAGRSLVDGIFFDEASTDPTLQTVLINIAFASLPSGKVVLNCGVQTGKELKMPNVLTVTCENVWAEWLNSVYNTHAHHQVVIPHGYKGKDWSTLVEADYAYVSPTSDADIWGVLHPEFASLVQFVEEHADRPPAPEPAPTPAPETSQLNAIRDVVTELEFALSAITQGVSQLAVEIDKLLDDGYTTSLSAKL